MKNGIVVFSALALVLLLGYSSVEAQAEDQRQSRFKGWAQRSDAWSHLNKALGGHWDQIPEMKFQPSDVSELAPGLPMADQPVDFQSSAEKIILGQPQQQPEAIMKGRDIYGRKFIIFRWKRSDLNSHGFYTNVFYQVQPDGLEWVIRTASSGQGSPGENLLISTPDNQLTEKAIEEFGKFVAGQSFERAPDAVDPAFRAPQPAGRFVLDSAKNSSQRNLPRHQQRG